MSLARWEETLRANLTATFLTARGFLRQGGRSLVLVGSTAGLFGEAGHADYAAAKAAILHGLLPSLKNEAIRIAPDARVNAVAPGWTESPMTRGLVDAEAVRRVSRTMALRKVARPEDVAAQVVALDLGDDLRTRHRPDRDRRGRHGGPCRPRIAKRRAEARRSVSPRTAGMVAVSPGSRSPCWSLIGARGLQLEPERQDGAAARPRPAVSLGRPLCRDPGRNGPRLS